MRYSAGDILSVLQNNGRIQTLACTSPGGLTDKLRGLLTCRLVSESCVLNWPDPLRVGKLNVTFNLLKKLEIFSETIGLTNDNDPEMDSYEGWAILAPSLFLGSPNALTFALDALNGDGFKSAAMLNFLPDAVHREIDAAFRSLFSAQMLEKIAEFEALLQGLRYAVISLRFWRECRKSVDISHDGIRLDVNFDSGEAAAFDTFLHSIGARRWTRIGPSLDTLLQAKRYIGDLGYENLIVMSDRFSGRSFYRGDAGLISDAVGRIFANDLEKALANYFVIAKADILFRSKDSGFNHLPILLNAHGNTLIFDI